MIKVQTREFRAVLAPKWLMIQKKLHIKCFSTCAPLILMKSSPSQGQKPPFEHPEKVSVKTILE